MRTRLALEDEKDVATANKRGDADEGPFEIYYEGGWSGAGRHYFTWEAPCGERVLKRAIDMRRRSGARSNIGRWCLFDRSFNRGTNFAVCGFSRCSARAHLEAPGWLATRS